MEDLGEAVENLVETFRCKEESSSRLPQKTIPATHGNLLVASSLYGHLFAAVGSSIVVYSHASLRIGDASPVAVVDLKGEHVDCIHALALGAYDTIIAHVATPSQRSIVVLNIAALAAGKIHALPGPSAAVNAFSVSETQSTSASPVLATLEGACVQLHDFTAEGTTPTTKISISNARCTALSPESDLLAVGTERGSIVIYNAKTGQTCSTIVEVESGWVPFATYFADNRSILVSYNCDAEVRHVVWHLSSDGAAVEGHSPLGELCLAFLPLDDDQPEEHPVITCVSLQDWNMCVIGSSMSSDVEIIRKTGISWEVWKFDEGKSPTLPTDDNDDDTCCVGLAFDLNNTALLPGSDAAAPNINPMPRVIVYTTESLLLPFALIDSTPGVKVEAIKDVAELPPIPVNLHSIRSASNLSTDGPCLPVNKPDTGTITYTEDQLRSGQRDVRPSPPAYSQQKVSVSGAARTEGDREGFLQTDPGGLGTDFGSRNATNSEIGSMGDFRPQQSFEGVNSFLGNFSFNDTSKQIPRPTRGVSSSFSSAVKPERGPLGAPGSAVIQEKPRLSLATSLDLAEAEVNGGDLFALIKSILTEMSEELRVSAEAERIVSKEIATQKDNILSSIAETRERLAGLLQFVRRLFRNEVSLRNGVSSTLSKVLSLSREYEKMSLEFHVKEADGFSRSLRAEEKEFDDKIASKEVEVLRSISSIEDRLNAEAEIQTRRRSPAELVQQVYSALSLQGIRIKRVRSLLAALSERMDNQDKGGRLSYLGLSLARLEKLNIHDEDVPDQSPSADKRRESPGREVVGTSNGVKNLTNARATSNQGNDTHVLPSDVRAVMRRLAMSGGRASISVTAPQSRTKRSRIITMKEGVIASDVLGNQTTTTNGGYFAGLEPSDVASLSLSASMMAGSDATRAANSVKSERAIAPVTSMSSRIADADKGNKLFNSRTLESQGQALHLHSAIPSPGVREVHNGNARLKTSTFPFATQTVRSQGTITGEGIQSALLPPKKPPGQTLFPSSVQRKKPASSLLNSTAFGDKKQKKHSELSPERSSVPSAKRQGSGNGQFVDVNKTTEKTREGVSSSIALTTSANAVGVGTASSHGGFGIQTLNLLSGHGQSSKNIDPLPLTAVAGAERSTKSGVQTANLPPDDNEGNGKQSMAAPAPQLATLPPDDEELSRKRAITASAPQLATLPRDDDEDRQEASIAASAIAQTIKVETPKSASLSGSFAALPPDPAVGLISQSSSDDKREKPLPSQVQESEKGTPVPGLFAALPPDPDTDISDKQEKEGVDKERNVFPFDGARLGSIDHPSSPSTKMESLGTSDLFASLPPDDTGNEQMRQAVTDENNANRPVAQPPSLIFTDGVPTVNTASPKMSQFASPFGAPEQSTAAFGSASLFGASSSGNQSAPTMSAPERLSSKDGTSTDESEEETSRFGGGMDTTSGGAGFFGASSSPQGSKQGFGFGSTQDSASGAATFVQSSTSPFGSVAQNQPFGQPSVSQPPTQTGFASFAGSQGSIPSAFQTAQPAFRATSAFGTANAPPAFGMDSTFGAPSQLGASSSFGVPSQLGMGGVSSNPTFGSGVSAPSFGESGFGITSSFGNFAQNSAGSGFGISSAASSASPFGNVAGGGGGGFGGTSGGGSGFAALAGGQSGGALIFGNGGGPPSFTSAAFSQRRA